MMELWFVSIFKFWLNMTVCDFLVFSIWGKLSVLSVSSFFVHNLESYGIASYQFEWHFFLSSYLILKVMVD